jgi:hypothetical protein
MDRRRLTTEEAFAELHRAWDDLWRVVWQERGDLMHLVLFLDVFLVCCLLAAGAGR